MGGWVLGVVASRKTWLQVSSILIFQKGKRRGEERRGEVYTETIILRYGNKLGLGLDFCCW